MKQRILKTIASACAVCMLAGCAGPSPSSGAGGGAPASGAPSGENMAVENTAPASSAAALRLVSDDEEFTEKMVGNEKGYYYIERSDAINANLRYIDYATAQDVYLSSRPEANHLTPEDDSYISSVAGYGEVFPVGESLFLVRTGAASCANQLGDDAMAAVYRMNLDGSDRKAIYLAGAEEELAPSAAADDRYLYLIAKRTETIEGVPSHMGYLIRMDQQTGKTEDLCRLTDSAYMIGAADGKIVFHSIYVKEEDASGPPAMRHEILLYDLAAQKLSVIQTWPQEEKARACVWGDLLVTASLSARTVSVREFASETEKAAYPFPEFVPQDLQSFWFTGCCDGHFVFDIEEALCTLDLSSGEWGRMTLTYDDPDKSEPRPVEIYAETATHFLVCRDKEVVTRRFIYPDDGTIYETQRTQPVFALIAKEDYWNSVPNYRPIQFNG